MAKTFFISTPIYYPSGKPHIGHAFSTILADTIAKYKKLIGYETFFLTGTDEHGKKLVDAAAKENMPIMQYLDQNVNIFKDLWKRLGINYNHFIRTTDEQHVKTVQKLFTKFYNKDLIYLDNWTSKYCVSCEENIPSKEIKTENGVQYCSVGHKLTDVSEQSYFFKMSKFADWIINEFTNHKNWITPITRVNELRNNFLETTLNDLSISRTSFDWGIPINENNKHVIYVWMDALFSYISALHYDEIDNELYEKFWANKDAEIVHLMSKEITRFHCVYWPIFLHALELPLPTKIISHGWIITKEGKMSKSLGNVIDPNMLLENFGRDCTRYYLLKEMSLSHDNIFSLETMIGIYNGDLANNIGNLISRTIGMIKKYNNNICPKYVAENLRPEDKTIIGQLTDCNNQIYDAIQQLDVSKILACIQTIINHANKYIEDSKPWELLKQNKMPEIHAILNILMNICKCVFFWLQPVLEDGCKSAFEQMQINPQNIYYKDLNDLNFVNDLKLGESKPIYIRNTEN